MDFVTSDTHFGHENIIKFCNRPFKNSKHMDLEMVRLWNETVGPDDNVFHVGDFSLSRHIDNIESYVKKLNGNIHLILGNHDELRPFQYVGAGFSSVHTSLDLGHNVIMAHDPATKNALPAGYKLIHGHVHTMWVKLNDIVNVSCDVWGYKPVELNIVKKLLDVDYDFR